MNLALLILNILGFTFLVRYVIGEVQAYRNAGDKRGFFTFYRFRHGISLALLIGIPFLLANLIFPLIFQENLFTENTEENIIFWIAAGLALLISLVWLIYVQHLDIYEPERWGYLAGTFILGGLCTFFLTGWMYLQLEKLGFAFSINDPAYYQFLYCVFIIGGVEELTKMIPVLIVFFFFRKAINEPYDFILYGSVSALGFAFVENIDYIFYSRLYNIGGRALYAVVAHMTFTSMICYGLMLWFYKLSRFQGKVIILSSFLLAITAHGFYDFWLISGWGVEYQAVTLMFFLLTIHLWVIMKNNAINVSTFFSPDISLSNDGLRYYLIISLTGLLMLGYLIVALMDGRETANYYLFYQSLAYGYLIFYLAFGLSRYRIVKDKMNPFRVPFDLLVPKPAAVLSDAPKEMEDEDIQKI